MPAGPMPTWFTSSSSMVEYGGGSLSDQNTGPSCVMPGNEEELWKGSRMNVWPYSTLAWKRLRRAKLAQTPTCEYCAPGTHTPATVVDHRKAICDGGDPWDMGNLVSCCAPCHNRKTAFMDGAGGNRRQTRVPVKGCDPATGRPLDPAHWWRQ